MDSCLFLRHGGYCVGDLLVSIQSRKKGCDRFYILTLLIYNGSTRSNQTGLEPEGICVVGSVCDLVGGGFSHRTLELDTPSTGKSTHY